MTEDEEILKLMKDIRSVVRKSKRLPPQRAVVLLAESFGHLLDLFIQGLEDDD